MNPSRLHELTRRAFLRRSGQLALSGAALPMSINLAAIGEAAAFDANDYKALVCVYLMGGNDQDNTVVPYDAAGHARYLAARSSLAVQRDQLAATLLKPKTPLPEGRQYALHPNLAGLAGLFNAGQAAVLLNVGPLVVPVTKAQYQGSNRTAYPLPPKLFSHNDQDLVWQSQRPEGSTVGWGGRIGDLALSSNGEALFTCIATEGQGVLLAGESALTYRISANGVIPLAPMLAPVYGSTAVRDAMKIIGTQQREGTLETEYNRVTARSLAAEGRVSSAMLGISLGTPFPGSHIGRQLNTVARLIAAQATLGVKRQVFMVQLGGFDSHGGLLGTHPRLIGEVGAAMVAFQSAMAELGVANKVTAFTASEFGRTLSNNGDGTDHGWGGHHFIVGGAVNGGRFYGTAPPVSTGSSSAPEDQWHTGQGRLIPTTSVDQFAATLARWFGVADSELDSILPNLHHFGTTAGGIVYPRTLGFV